MFVSLNITLKKLKFLGLFVAVIGTNDAGVTNNGFKGYGLKKYKNWKNMLKVEKYKKNF